MRNLWMKGGTHSTVRTFRVSKYM